MKDGRAGAHHWRRSSRCDNGFCVEVAVRGAEVAVRSTVDPGTVLTISVGQWRVLLDAIRTDGLSLRCE